LPLEDAYEDTAKCSVSGSFCTRRRNFGYNRGGGAGPGRLFRKTDSFILVFRGNVNGLRFGAPVNIKSVTIGSVTDMQLRLNLALESVASSHGGIQIPVLIEIDENRITHGASGLSISQDVSPAVQQGLRAQLAMDGFGTGILYIDLDMHPGTRENYAMPPDSTPQEIPRLKTNFEQAPSAATLNGI
jgi:paraquat-inducible protein B